jgi:hypothetical protein
VSEKPEIAETKAQPAKSRRDRGMSFVEVLVAVVLLGTVVVSILTATRAIVIGSHLERDHAKAHQWLQSASENVQLVDRIGCDLPNTEASIRGSYQDTIRLASDNPTGWADDRIEIVAPIRFWDGEDYLAPPSCFDDEGKFLQLIEIQVKSADGEIIERVQVVKRD